MPSSTRRRRALGDEPGRHRDAAGVDQRVLHLHLRHDRPAEGQRDEPQPLAGQHGGIGGMAVRLRHSDTMYIPLPLYHNNALSVSLGSVLAAGASVAIAKQFSASRFWDDIILNRATAFCYIGELCRIPARQPPKPTDRSTGAPGRGATACPEIWDEFSERFGIKRIVEFYGASEPNLAFVNVFTVEDRRLLSAAVQVVEYDQETGEARRDTKGRLRSVRRAGGPADLEISSRVPLDGYTDSAATEKKIIRDGFKDGDSWFNSGDLVREVGWGHIAFVDRLGDVPLEG